MLFLVAMRQCGSSNSLILICLLCNKLNEKNNSHVPVAQWLEHCVSSAKVVGSQGTHILTINV